MVAARGECTGGCGPARETVATRRRGPSHRSSDRTFSTPSHAQRMSPDPGSSGTPGTRAVFTVCLAVIAVGLIVMIALPLMGR